MAFQWTHLPTHTYFSIHFPCKRGYTVPLRLKRFQLDKISSIPHLKDWTSLYLFFRFSFSYFVFFFLGVPSSCFNWDSRVAHARAGRELPLAPCCYTAGFEDVYIQQSAILSLPAMILKPHEGLKSHEAEQPFCLRFLGTGTRQRSLARGIIATLSLATSSSHFYTF